MKYIQSLDWNIQDNNDVLFPLQMAVSAVSWSATKGIERLKFTDDTTIESQRIQLLLCLSSIFRLISQHLYTSFIFISGVLVHSIPIM